MITQRELKKLLSYSKETGLFTVVSNWNKCKYNIGDIVGNVNYRGYLRVKINYKEYSCHRLAFLYMEGYFPEHIIDHKDRNKLNNRWNNLRHVSARCNNQNKGFDKRNKTGYTGVRIVRGGKVKKYESRITINGKTIHLGNHNDIVSAVLARICFEDCCDDWHCDYINDNRLKLRKLGFKV